MKKLSLWAAVTGALLATPAIYASPTITVSIQESGVSGSLTASSSTGYVDLTNTSYGDFTLNQVTGVGTGPNYYTTPELNLQTLDLSSTSTGPKTLMIWVTETGLTPVSASEAIMNQLTDNVTGVTSATEYTYYDNTNAADGTQHLLATTTFTGDGAHSYNTPSVINGVTPYSESIEIIANFAGTGGVQTLDASGKITPAVPEPMSMGLIGGGLAILGIARLRKSRKA